MGCGCYFLQEKVLEFLKYYGCCYAPSATRYGLWKHRQVTITRQARRAKLDPGDHFSVVCIRWSFDTSSSSHAFYLNKGCPSCQMTIYTLRRQTTPKLEKIDRALL